MKKEDITDITLYIVKDWHTECNNGYYIDAIYQLAKDHVKHTHGSSYEEYNISTTLPSYAQMQVDAEKEHKLARKKKNNT